MECGSAGVSVRFAGGGGSVFPSGNSVRARRGISHGFVAGCGGAMEGRSTLPALDGVGQLWIWRAAIYFLSTAFVDFRSISRDVDSLAVGGTGIQCLRSGFSWALDVRADAKNQRQPICGAAWSRMLRRESLCAADHLYAQRFRGTAGDGILSATFSGGAES